MTNLYIECGSTLKSPYNTGIQRVVRSIIEQKTIVEDKFQGLNVVYVDYHHNNFHIILPHKKFNIKHYNYFFNFFKSIKKYCPLKIRNFLIGFIESAFNKSIEKNPSILLTQKNFPSEQHILLLLDATWSNDMWGEVSRFRACGGSVCAVLYDLIPFMHPETVEANTRELHTNWWRHAIESIDSVMCISKTVRDQFYEWQDKNIKNPIPVERVDYFYLGADFSCNDPLIKVISSNSPFFLMVGSIEPRKNHSLVLKAFDCLWASKHDVSLVLCANNDWNSEDLISRIKSHKEFNKRLFLFEGVSDRDLMYLNKCCCAAIMASFAEGFGLPIIEALSQGAKVICNDIPIFREVGLDNVEYFSFNNQESLEDIIINHVNEWGKLGAAKKQSNSWITWGESATMLVDKVLEISNKS